MKILKKGKLPENVYADKNGQDLWKVDEDDGQNVFVFMCNKYGNHQSGFSAYGQKIRMPIEKFQERHCPDYKSPYTLP